MSLRVTKQEFVKIMTEWESEHFSRINHLEFAFEDIASAGLGVFVKKVLQEKWNKLKNRVKNAESLKLSDLELIAEYNQLISEVLGE